MQKYQLINQTYYLLEMYFYSKPINGTNIFTVIINKYYFKFNIIKIFFLYNMKVSIVIPVYNDHKLFLRF